MEVFSSSSSCVHIGKTIWQFAWQSVIASTIGILLCGPVTSAFAWGDEGHRIIAEIAYGRLQPAALKTLEGILAADSDSLTSPGFVDRAIWADRWRDSDRNGQKVRYLATRQWHYADIELVDGSLARACNQFPLLPAGTLASNGPANDCLVSKIEQFVAELRNANVSSSEKRFALKFLLHLVGDLHQPLHIADNNDRGGNNVLILFGGGRKATSPRLNLHHYWDTELVSLLKVGKKETAAETAQRLTAHFSTPEVDLWTQGTPRSWAMETFTTGRDVASNFLGTESRTLGGTSVLYLNATYNARALPVVRQQLMKAGLRLAAVLNTVH